MSPDSASQLLGYHCAQSLDKAGPPEIIGFRSRYQESVSPDPLDRHVYDGTAHLMTVAPTGTGKGRGVVIPTLLSYPGSIVVLDPKGENYQVTARARREMGQQVVRLDPFGVAGPDADSFNMLDVFKLPGINIETEAQMMAELFSQGNRGVKDPFWDLNACMLLAGVISYVVSVKPPEEQTLSTVHQTLFCDDAVYAIAVILDTVGKKLPKSTYQQLAAFLSMPDRETRPSVLATAYSYLAAFLSEDVNKATSTSTLSLEEFRDGKPMTIYLILPPDKLISHRALIKLWIGVLLKTITSRQTIPDQQTLFLLDEAGQLGHFAYLYSIITLCRGYGLKCWTIWQDFQQLEANYPNDWQTLMNNCGMVQFFGGKNYQVARKVESITGVPAARVMQMDSNQQLLMMDGLTILSHKLDYLTDGQYKNRFDPNPFYKNHPPLGGPGIS